MVIVWIRLSKILAVNWLIPTLQDVYPAGRNTLPAHKRECFPPISDSLPPSVGRAGLGNAKEYFCISLAQRSPVIWWVRSNFLSAR